MPIGIGLGFDFTLLAGYPTSALPPSSYNLLKEDGDAILLENGDNILLESAP